MQKIFILSLLCLLLPACASMQWTSPADAEFHRTADQFLDGYLAWRPQTGTGLGLHPYDGKITDMSAASLAAEQARLKDFDQRFAALDASRLSPTASRDLRIVRNAIRRELLTFQDMQSYTRNPMTYAGAFDVNIYIKRDFAPLEQRVASITAILRQAPAVFAAARANLAESLPRPFIETAIQESDGSADFLGKDLVEALKGFDKQPQRAEFNAANARAIEELHAYSAYLKQEKLPKANDRYALGRDIYAKLLDYGEMITLSPEQVLDVGMRELHAKQQAFAETARLIDPTKPPLEVFNAIQKDHPTEQGLIPDTAKNLEAIRRFLIDHQVISVPSDVRAQVMETPQFARATSFASMDTPGPFETKATEAYYYVTPVEADWSPQQKEEWLTAFNYYTTDIVSIHEAYPGHYIQFLHLNASSATRLEKIFGSYAFIEGWAHYCEQMLVDEGYGSGADAPVGSAGNNQKLRAAKYRLAQIDEALLRICRLCVSIKMHTQGMTVDEATKFFHDNCYYGEKPAHAEAMRGTFDPEYLFYTVGKLEILKLREDYRRQEGTAFSLRKFHDEMLNHGMPPVRLLREVMLKDPASWPDTL